MDERSVATEQYVEFPCGVENLSPYSSNSSYTEQTAYYQPEYDWQQQQQQQQQQQHQMQQQQQQQLDERHMYPMYGQSGDVTSHYAYSQHPGTADYYQAPGMWAPTADSLSAGQMSAQRFFSGIDVSQQSRGMSSGTNPDGSKPKRKRVQSHSQRKAANVRERRRMFHLNEAFDELRKRLPAFNYEKRLSRIETLRLAMTYISFMKDVSVGRDPKSVKLKPHGAELGDLLPHGGDVVVGGEGLMTSQQAYTNGKMMTSDIDSDCSGDEGSSNHSG